MAAERVSGHCASLYHPNNSISLRESFRFQTTPTGFGSGQICQAFSPVAAKHRIIHCLLSLLLISSPTSPFLSFSFSGMKPLTGRWADGDRQRSPGRKLIGRDWERIWRCWIVLTWWENQCTLPVYLHHAEVRHHSLMLSLLGVIKSFVSTLTPHSDNPAQDRGDITIVFMHFSWQPSACTHCTYYKLRCWTSLHTDHQKKIMTRNIINHFYNMYVKRENQTHVLFRYLLAADNLLEVLQATSYACVKFKKQVRKHPYCSSS